MKVLLLPVNVASDISHKVRALRKIGVDARGLSIAESTIQSSEGIRTFSVNQGPRGIANLITIANFGYIWRLIAWADILHWIADVNVFAGKYNFAFLQWINKPGVVQWMGSDIRIPEFDFPSNPYYRKAFDEGYEYPTESVEISRANQRRMAQLNFYPLEFAGLKHYVDRKLFPKGFDTFQPIDLLEYESVVPAESCTKPMIFHAPSAPVAKGTKYVLEAIDRIAKRHDVELRIAKNVPRHEVLSTMQKCDIFVDQLILGSHGYAAVEAMAFGKPVVCYINPEIRKDYPEDLPIINATPDNIEETLEALILDPPWRRQIGQKSRIYAEKYHDDRKVAQNLIRVYGEVIGLHRKFRQR